MVVASGEHVGAVVPTVGCVVNQFITDQSRMSSHVRTLPNNRDPVKQNELTLVPHELKSYQFSSRTGAVRLAGRRWRLV